MYLRKSLVAEIVGSAKKPACNLFLLELCNIIFDKQKINIRLLYFAKNHCEKFLKSRFFTQL